MRPLLKSAFVTQDRGGAGYGVITARNVEIKWGRQPSYTGSVVRCQLYLWYPRGGSRPKRRPPFFKDQIRNRRSVPSTQTYGTGKFALDHILTKSLSRAIRVPFPAVEHSLLYLAEQMYLNRDSYINVRSESRKIYLVMDALLPVHRI